MLPEAETEGGPEGGPGSAGAPAGASHAFSANKLMNRREQHKVRRGAMTSPNQWSARGAEDNK